MVREVEEKIKNMYVNYSCQGISQEFKGYLDKVNFHLPKYYLNLLKNSNGGYVDYIFKYFDAYSLGIENGNIGVYYGVGLNSSSNDIEQEYLDRPDWFPDQLLPFGENGCGDYLCFDYRTETLHKNPPVVWLSHDSPEEKNISLIANSFEEFIDMLEEPDDGVLETHRQFNAKKDQITDKSIFQYDQNISDDTDICIRIVTEEFYPDDITVLWEKDGRRFDFKTFRKAELDIKPLDAALAYVKNSINFDQKN